MKPLSALNYYKNNLKKLNAVFMAISLSVFLLYIIQMLVISSFKTEYLAFVEPQKHFSCIRPKGELLSEKLIEDIRNNPATGYVAPFIFNFTYITNTIGSDTGTRILSLTNTDINIMMDKLALKLKSGRLPKPGTDEVVLHQLVAENKGLKLGGVIGSNSNKLEAYPGKHTVVGILQGSSIISFDSLETWMQESKIKNPERFGIVIIPLDGKRDGLNSYLDLLPYGSIETRTLNSSSKQLDKSESGIRIILTVIDIIVLTIVSLCVGFLCYIYFYQRRTEFGLLAAIGYTRQEIINRAFVEVGGISVVGFIMGIVLALLAGLLLDVFLFKPLGQLLFIWDWGYLLEVLCIPLFVTLFSIIPIWRMLGKLDPISIIEGEV